jgi:ubiquinone/menaquinone biosynthesis C-methylase UbiE
VTVPPASAATRPAPASDWWSTYFTEAYLLEFAPLFNLEEDRHQVARLVDLLGLPDGSRLLDVPCGQGRHAHLLAEAGFDVDALDYSPELLARARKRGTGSRLRYTRGDMRSLPSRWNGRFDGVVNLFTSFGFFADPNDDVRVIGEFARVLRPGGTLVWHGGSRDGLMARFLGRDSWITANQTTVSQERRFDPLPGILTVRSTLNAPGRVPVERDHQIRIYTATRLAELCREAGLVVEGAFDGWATRPLRRTSTEMLLVARKRA